MDKCINIYLNKNFQLENDGKNIFFGAYYYPITHIFSLHSSLKGRLYCDVISAISSKEDLLRFSQKLLKNIFFI